MTEHELFEAVVDLPDAAARAAYLDEACAGDAGRRARIDALLRSHEMAGSFLGTPAVGVGGGSGADPAETTEFDSTPVGDAGRDGVVGGGDGKGSGSGSGAGRLAEDDELRGILTPSTRPGSLGRLGHYEVLQVLGRGGFGVVFRAFDDVLQRVVAVKMMVSQMAATSPARKRFLREAQASAAVRHENVVQVYEVVEQPVPYLVMEFIPGETLQSRIDRSGPLDVPETLRIGRQIAEGLAAAHTSDLIHRDIKPGNVLLEGGTHRVKLTDFGLARAADDASMTQSGMIAGTPLYMAPEQALGQGIDQRADLFSLGSVLYHMVTGRPPFRANNTLAVMKRVAEDTPRPIREIIPEAPQWLGDIISKLHAKDPAGRFASAREVADVLADCEGQLKAGSKLRDFSRIPRAAKPTGTATAGGRRKWVAAAAVLIPLVALAVTEMAGVTHVFRGRPAGPVADGGGGAVSEKPAMPVLPAVALAKSEPPPVAVAAPAQAPLPTTFTNGIGMEFVIVPKGKSWLGGGKDKLGDKEFEIRADFYLGKYEVTQEEWEQVMGENPSFFSRNGQGKDAVKDVPDADLKRFPVETVLWDNCQLFVAKLNRREKETGWVYRLPTEAEWEYACRGGPMSDRLDSAFGYYFARPTNTLLPDQANFNKGLNRTGKVGSYEANRLGLFDMHGNVWEWCQNVRQGPDGAPRRVFWGGCWTFEAETCVAASHFVAPPDGRDNTAGLRLARVPADDAPMGGGGSAVAPPGNGPPGATVGATGVKAGAQPTLPARFTNGIGMEFVIVPKGKSWLGGGKDKRGENEVEIPADFYLGKYEVTQAEWEKVMGESPSHFSRTGAGKDAVKDVSDADLKRFPVENVSWDQCQAFVEKLNKLGTETGWAYRLPTRAEWEYACRGGAMADKADSAFDFYFARPSNTLLTADANFDNGMKRTCAVGSYRPNRLGLFDLHGNVQEWCGDGEPATTDYGKRLRGGSFRIGRCEAKGVAGARSTFLSDDLGLRLARVPAGAPLPEAKTAPLAVAAFTDADAKRIAALPAAEQVEAVRAALKRLNPEFDGVMEPTIDGGVVVGLAFSTDHVADVSPVRGLAGLRVLVANGSTNDKGVLADLSPLKGMALTDLGVGNNPIRDLTPLQGMPLKWLFLWQWRGADLSPLKGMPLEWLNVGGGGQALDLAPLAGMPLTFLCVNVSEVSDLAPLKGLPLTMLECQYTAVSDVAPLRGMRLERLRLANSKVSDLAAIREMPIVELTIEGTAVADLSALKGLPLRRLKCDFDAKRDGAILRGIGTLETINGKAAGEVLKGEE